MQKLVARVSVLYVYVDEGEGCVFWWSRCLGWVSNVERGVPKTLYSIKGVFRFTRRKCGARKTLFLLHGNIARYTEKYI